MSISYQVVNGGVEDIVNIHTSVLHQRGSKSDIISVYLVHSYFMILLDSLCCTFDIFGLCFILVFMDMVLPQRCCQIC